MGLFLASLILSCGTKNEPEVSAAPPPQAAQPLRAIWLLHDSSTSTAEYESTLLDVEERGFNAVVFPLKSDDGSLAFDVDPTAPRENSSASTPLQRFQQARQSSTLEVIYQYPIKWGRADFPPLPTPHSSNTETSIAQYSDLIPNSFAPDFWSQEFRKLETLRDKLLAEPTTKPPQLLFSHLAFTDRFSALHNSILQQFIAQANLPSTVQLNDVLRFDSLGRKWIEGPYYPNWLNWRRAVVYQELQALLEFWGTQTTTNPISISLQGEGIQPLALEKAFSLTPPRGATAAALSANAIYLECFTPYVYGSDAIAAGILPSVSLQEILASSRAQLAPGQQLVAVLSIPVFAGDDGLISEQEKSSLQTALSLAEQLANGWVLVDSDFVESANIRINR